MLGNGTLLYDHDQDGRPTELGGCTAMARNTVHDTFVLVRYLNSRLTVWSSQNNLRCGRDALGCLAYGVSEVISTCWTFLHLQLMVDVDGKREWKECADITGLRLPRGYFFGASSATGDLSGGPAWPQEPLFDHQNSTLGRLDSFVNVGLGVLLTWMFL